MFVSLLEYTNYYCIPKMRMYLYIQTFHFLLDSIYYFTCTKYTQIIYTLGCQKSADRFFNYVALGSQTLDNIGQVGLPLVYIIIIFYYKGINIGQAHKRILYLWLRCVKHNPNIVFSEINY